MRWSKTFCFLLQKKIGLMKLESQKNCCRNQISFVLCWGDFNELFSWLGVLIFTVSSFVFSFYRKMNTGAPTGRDLDLSKPLYLFFAINNQGFGRGMFKTNIAPLAMHCLSDIRPEPARGLINFDIRPLTSWTCHLKTPYIASPYEIHQSRSISCMERGFSHTDGASH